MKRKYILITLFLLLAVYFLLPFLNDLSQDKIPYPIITIGDTNILKDIEINSYASPIFLEGNEKAVLIIHGYLASPQEVEQLANYLNEKGYTVFAPLMEGHGSDYKDLENVSWEDWMEESEYYYGLLDENYEEVKVIGFSLGSLSALELSMNYELDSLTVIGSPIFIFLEEINDLDFYVEEISEYIPYFKKANVITDIVIGRQTYSFIPTSSVLEVMEYSEEVRDNLGKVDDEIFIVHGNFDTTSDPYSSEYIYENISSEEKEIYYVNSLHTVLMGIHDQDVFENILEFIES